jgi:hypothetical protein
MSFEALVLTVLIASPGDTKTLRKAVEGAVAAWNRDRAHQARVVLLPRRWETDAVPLIGSDDAQSVINKQLVDEADIVVGLFHSRLGNPTSRGPSGTAEEIERSAQRGIPVHVYFAEMPYPTEVDTDQLSALREFRHSLEDRGQGLVGTFTSLEDLVAKVRTALERDVAEHSGDVQPARAGTQGRAVIRARYAFDREPNASGRMQTTRSRLVISNIGDAPAEQLRVAAVEPVGSGDPPQFPYDPQVDSLPPGESVEFLLIIFMSVAQQWRITTEWVEHGEQRRETQVISGF